MYQTRIDTGHLPPELQELVDTIIGGVVALASRVNSNTGSNPVCATMLYKRQNSCLRYGKKSFRPVYH
jgi:hypothetical protein